MQIVAGWHCCRSYLLSTLLLLTLCSSQLFTGQTPDEWRSDSNFTDTNSGENAQRSDYPLQTDLSQGVVSHSTQGRSNHANNSSALSFGANSGSNSRVEPSMNFNIAVNLSNTAGFSDTALIDVTSTSGWTMQWQYAESLLDGHNWTVDDQELIWVQFSIQLPEVINGTPYAGSKHPFSVRATSQHDSSQSFWNFTVEVEPWAGIAIDTIPTNKTVAPSNKVRIPVTLRNIGNEISGLSVRVEPATADGTPIGIGADQIFVWNGWQVGIFDAYNINNLQQNGSGTIQIEFLAPAQTSGNISALITAWNPRASQQVVSVLHTVSIDHQRAANLSIVEENCDKPKPGTTCSAVLAVRNDGNFDDQLELSIAEAPTWVDIQLSRNQISLIPSQTISDIGMTMTIADNTAARLTDDIVITVLQDGEEIARTKLNLVVGTYVDWTLGAVASTSDDENVTVAYTLVNIGNDGDGILVSVDSNVATSFGLIPTSGALFESGDNPRSFEMQDVPPNTNLTFRAWLVIPRDQPFNGTALLTVRIQSILAPDTVFTNQTEVEYLGAPWRPENLAPEGFSLSAFFSEVLLSAEQNNGFILTIIVTVAGALILHRALQHRQQKDEEWRLKQGLDVPPPETEQDWQSKFVAGSESQPAPDIISETVSNAEFEAGFRQKSGYASVSRPPPDDELVKAASTVFDAHQSESDFSAQFDLADDLLTTTSTHSDNELFEPSNSQTGRTNRKERQKGHLEENRLVGEKKISVISSNKSTPSTPPTKLSQKSDLTNENSEEFDLDL